jgi:hypothetical protein
VTLRRGPQGTLGVLAKPVVTSRSGTSIGMRRRPSRQDRSVLAQATVAASDKVSVKTIPKYSSLRCGRGRRRMLSENTGSPPRTPTQGHSTSRSRMTAGPTTTIISTGKMQKIVGKIIFIDNLAASASAA